MYLFAPKFRYALRLVLRGAAIFGLMAAVFATALPFLINDRAVRDRLVQSLSQWSGGPVAIHGNLRIESFSSLSIEANGVSFSATPRLSPVERIEAKSVSAVLRLPSLLRGRVEFKKVALDAPRFVLSRRGAFFKTDTSGIEAADAVIAFAGLSPFERLELKNCAVFAAEGERRAYSRFSAETISLTRDSSGSLFGLYLVDRGLEASFRGSLNHPAGSALGAVSLNVPAEHPAAGKIVAAIAPWERGNGISIEGDLTWAGGRLSLDADAIGFGGHSAKGSLTFAARQGRGLTEGTLAYDRFEWLPAARDGANGSGSATKSLRTLIAASSGGEGSDFDMRISAERFRAGPQEAGPLALALTSRAGHLSVDVAELAIFGGRVEGRMDYDSQRPTVLNVSASGSQLDSEALARASAWPVAVSGPIAIRAALEIPFKDQPLSQELKAATGAFDIAFPVGGSFYGEAGKRLSEAFAQEEAPWGSSFGSIPFSAASIEGAIKPGTVALKIDAEAAGSRIAGSLRVTTADGQVSGTLTVAPAGRTEGALPVATGASASVDLTGAAAALALPPLDKPSLPN